MAGSATVRSGEAGVWGSKYLSEDAKHRVSTFVHETVRSADLGFSVFSIGLMQKCAGRYGFRRESVCISIEMIKSERIGCFRMNPARRIAVTLSIHIERTYSYFRNDAYTCIC